MKKESSFGQILEERKENKKTIKKGKENWLYDYTSPNTIWAYEKTFQNIIDQPWDEFLKEQKERHGLTAAMDFMGGGSCFNDLQWLDKKLAVRLLDNGPNSLFQLPPQEKERLLEVDVIAGDVLSKNTWKEISLWVEKETQGRGFDLILSRPIGGLLHITFNIDTWYFLIENLWSLLDNDGGALYTQLPLPNYDEHEISPGSRAESLVSLVKKKKENIMNWVKLLETESSFGAVFSDNKELPHIHCDYAVLRLRKTIDSPPQLPKLI